MMEVNVREYLKHDFTPQEIAERAAWGKEFSKHAAEIQKESPLPDDIMDAVYGRKYNKAVIQQ
jgi:hypothetical protein